MAEPLLAELSEKDASGTVAEIYQDLRFSLRVPMVNLIFRHLATVPECLEWFWSRVGPHYVSGELAAAAARLSAAQRIPRLTLKPADCGLDEPAREAVLLTCDSYARANPANLLGLRIAELYLDATDTDGADAHTPHVPFPRAAAAPLDVLPPMARLEQLSPDVRALLRKLATQVHGEDGPVIPSFYRHFTEWPEFLRALHAHLPAVLPEVNAAIPAFEREAIEIANRLYATRAGDPWQQPSAPCVAALRAVLQRFPPNLCRMTLLPLAIQTALR